MLTGSSLVGGERDEPRTEILHFRPYQTNPPAPERWAADHMGGRGLRGARVPQPANCLTGGCVPRKQPKTAEILYFDCTKRSPPSPKGVGISAALPKTPPIKNRTTVPSPPKTGRGTHRAKRKTEGRRRALFFLAEEELAAAPRGLSETQIRTNGTHARARDAFHWRANALARDRSKRQSRIRSSEISGRIFSVFPQFLPCRHPRGYAP